VEVCWERRTATEVDGRPVHATVSIGVVVGTLIGLTAGHYGAWVDDVLMRTMDALRAFPALVLAPSINAVLGPGVTLPPAIETGTLALTAFWVLSAAPTAACPVVALWSPLL